MGAAPRSVDRSAVPTEDHPLDYADFEGIIPEGEHGAGVVLLWDRGVCENITEKDGKRKSITDALADGQLVIHLQGEKLNGEYAPRRIAKGKNPPWLLIKVKDDEADARRDPISSQPKSVLSGGTLKKIENREKD